MLSGVRYGLKNKAMGIFEEVPAFDATRGGGCQTGQFIGFLVYGK